MGGVEVGTVGMCARLVVVPKSICTAIIYINIVPMRLEELEKLCKLKGSA